MAVSIAVVCEATADKATACGLADRVFCDNIDWITNEVLDAYRRWRGQEPHESHLTWREIANLARQNNIKVHGHFDGEPGAPDAHAARRALLLLKKSSKPPDAVVLVRDDDRQTMRRHGLEQARKHAKITVPVVIGLAHTKRECWVLAGFEPCNADEQNALELLRQELGFDPRERAHELTAKHDHDHRNAKRVLRGLVGDDIERETQCWMQTPLGTLVKRGQETGLADYLDEVQTRLVPWVK